jgi:hypothetical protein
MKTKLLKNLRNQAFENIYFYGRWSGVWITKIDNINYESSIVSGLGCITGNDKGFLYECIIRAVKARKGEEVSRFVDLE